MANELDEMTSVANPHGRDVFVIEKQLPVKVGVGSTIFEIVLWVLAIIPGLIFLLAKVNAKKYLQQLQQKLQHDASQIDNYLEQRVVILTNCKKLMEKATELDSTVFANIAKYRSGISDDERNVAADAISAASRSINVALENYPDLQAHAEIRDAMRQNEYLQKEITAARELYNDTVYRWNSAIYEWPAKMIVAAKQGYTTRIPFSTTSEVKEKARDVIF